MRTSMILGVLWALLGCSSGGQLGCPEGTVACGEECLAPSRGCSMQSADGGADQRAGDAALSGLTVSTGMLSPAFASDVTMYSVQVPYFLNALQVTATATDGQARIKVNGLLATSGQPSPAIPLIGAVTMISVTVQGTGEMMKVYSLAVIRGQATAQYLKESNSDINDSFGHALVMSGDTLAVSAIYEASKATGIGGDQYDNSAPYSGAVYVFRRDQSGWKQEAYIKASNAEANDYFGFSIALSGDTLIVGAIGEGSKATGINGSQTDNSAPGSGAVYVFVRSGTTWTQQAYIKASNTEADDAFGFHVSLSGETLAVGARKEDCSSIGVNGPQNNNSAKDSGAAYVFTRSGTTWTQQAYLKASNTEAYDEFGFQVAVFGDTLAIGAIREASKATGIDGNQLDNSAKDSGAVYIFTRIGVNWLQQAYVKASNTDVEDMFGSTLSLYGDTLAVGGIYEDSKATGVNGDQADNSAPSAGAVYVFSRTGTKWTQQAYLKASNADSTDMFSISLSLFQDTLAVSAYQESSKATTINGDQSDNSAQYSGAVYLFQRTGVSWAQQAYIKAPNAEGGDALGQAVSVSGTTVVASAPGESSKATGIGGDQSDNSARYSGAVYVFQ